MKKIVLIRHAKVDIDESQKIYAKELKLWVKAYDTAPIHSESRPNQVLCSLVQNSSIVMTSNLDRSIESAKRLGVTVFEKSSLFNEVKIPDAYLFSLRLRAKTWLMILRLLLFAGFGAKDTSLKASKQQAKKATQKLIELSKEHETVVVVGHGGMNWLMHKVLLNEGWILEGKPSHKNWGMTVLSKK